MEQTFEALIEILQKHANAIRKLQILNIALMDLAKQEAARRGENPEQFEQRFLELLSSVEAKAPHAQSDIAKEILETFEMLELLRKGKLN